MTHRTRTRLEDRNKPREPQVVSRERIARLAYSYWEARGRQGGSAEEDWFRAERELAAIPAGAAPSTEVSRSTLEAVPRSKEYLPEAS